MTNNLGAPHKIRDLSDDELFSLVDQLTDTWTSRTDISIRVEGHTNLAPFGTVYGLTAHAHRLAAAAVPMLRLGLTLEAVPTVRAIYENALTAVWCAQVPGAPIALLNKHARQRKAFIRTLEQSKSLHHYAATVSEEEPIITDSVVSAEQFEQMCNDLEPGGADAYAHFRLMSSMTHPSAFLCDFYLADSSDSPVGVALRGEPEQPAPGPYLFFIVASLVWCGRAVEYRDMKHPRRSQLRAVARRLGITGELQPSAAALGRQA